jgi:hypothetical protein
MIDDGSEPIYETIHFSDISKISEHISGLTNQQCENNFEPTALVAQVSYDNGNDTTSWIIDSGSTHRMNGFANEFLSMTFEGYDDGLLIKGLVSSTKAFGIGSCIVVVKDSVGLSHQICLDDVLYFIIIREFSVSYY